MRRRSAVGRAGVVLLALAAVECAPAPDVPGVQRYRHASGIAFEYPTDWRLHDASVSFAGGSVIAVLGTQPVPERCGTGHVDVSCYTEQPLAPGTVSIIVGTGSFGGATLFDDRARSVPEVGRTQAEVGGLPAIVHRYGPGAYAREDEAIGWEIAFPTSVLRAWVIEARLRGPGLDGMRAALDRLIASIAFEGTGPPVADGPAGAAAAVEAALEELDRRERRSHVANPEHVTWYACFPPAAGDEAQRVISLGPDGPLERLREVRCRWSAAPEGRYLWRVRLEVDGLGHRETLWLLADGTLAGSRREGRRADALLP